MKILVTGGAGFIGSNFIRYMLKKYPNYKIVNLDKLTYAGNLDNLKEVVDNENYKFVKGDICDKKLIDKLFSEETFDALVNFAAETHVDRSILEPDAFLKTDIFGTFNLLEAMKKHSTLRGVFISTDEVFGDWAGGGFAKENDRLEPSSPYSASKAGGDLMVMAYRRTYDLPVMITHGTNNYGPNQYPEKLIPLFVTNLMENMKVPVYGAGDQIRDWIYVEDHCSGIDTVLHKGELGQSYNIGANNDPEITNMELTKTIVKLCDKDSKMIEYVKDRPGHDVRYAVDTTRLRNLGWKPKINFEDGIKKTVSWYQGNTEWWKKIKSGEYMEYYKKQYKDR